MNEIKWLEVVINTTPDQLDNVTAKLIAAGMDGLVIEDEADFLSFLEVNKAYWDYVDQELLDRMKGVTRVKFYVTDDETGHAQLKQYTAKLDCDDVATLYIAGGFGSYLDVGNAGKIGLLPEELTDRVTVLGNAALTGAAMLLLCDDLRPVCETLARETKVVELATNPVFVSEYMERMMF
jgi:hypothetical protein